MPSPPRVSPFSIREIGSGLTGAPGKLLLRPAFSSRRAEVHVRDVTSPHTRPRDRSFSRARA